MPEIRCTDVYKDGVKIGEEDYVEISDEQLYFEQLERETNEAHTAMLQAYRNYDKLKPHHKDQLLKALLRYYLVQERDRFLSVL